jgi:hypothetical protein
MRDAIDGKSERGADRCNEKSSGMLDPPDCTAGSANGLRVARSFSDLTERCAPRLHRPLDSGRTGRSAVKHFLCLPADLSANRRAR